MRPSRSKLMRAGTYPRSSSKRYLPGSRGRAPSGSPRLAFSRATMAATWAAGTWARKPGAKASSRTSSVKRRRSTSASRSSLPAIGSPSPSAPPNPPRRASSPKKNPFAFMAPNYHAKASPSARGSLAPTRASPRRKTACPRPKRPYSAS